MAIEIQQPDDESAGWKPPASTSAAFPDSIQRGARPGVAAPAAPTTSVSELQDQVRRLTERLSLLEREVAALRRANGAPARPAPASTVADEPAGTEVGRATPPGAGTGRASMRLRLRR